MTAVGNHTLDNNEQTSTVDMDFTVTDDTNSDGEDSMVEHDVVNTTMLCNERSEDNTTESLDTFLAESCKCQLAQNGPCSTLFPQEHFISMRENCAEMSRVELDMVVLGQLSAFTNNSQGVVTTSHHPFKSRKRSYTQYYHGGQRICQVTFCRLFNIGSKRLRNLTNHHKKMGLIS